MISSALLQQYTAALHNSSLSFVAVTEALCFVVFILVVVCVVFSHSSVHDHNSWQNQTLLYVLYGIVRWQGMAVSVRCKKLPCHVFDVHPVGWSGSAASTGGWLRVTGCFAPLLGWPSLPLSSSVIKTGVNSEEKPAVASQHFCS